METKVDETIIDEKNIIQFNAILDKYFPNKVIIEDVRTFLENIAKHIKYQRKLNEEEQIAYKNEKLGQAIDALNQDLCEEDEDIKINKEEFKEFVNFQNYFLSFLIAYSIDPKITQKSHKKIRKFMFEKAQNNDIRLDYSDMVKLRKEDNLRLENLEAMIQVMYIFLSKRISEDELKLLNVNDDKKDNSTEKNINSNDSINNKITNLNNNIQDIHEELIKVEKLNNKQILFTGILLIIVILLLIIK